jgi:hypothetical protein
MTVKNLNIRATRNEMAIDRLGSLQQTREMFSADAYVEDAEVQREQ